MNKCVYNKFLENIFEKRFELLYLFGGDHWAKLSESLSALPQLLTSLMLPEVAINYYR